MEGGSAKPCFHVETAMSREDSFLHNHCDSRVEASIVEEAERVKISLLPASCKLCGGFYLFCKDLGSSLVYVLVRPGSSRRTDSRMHLENFITKPLALDAVGGSSLQ